VVSPQLRKHCQQGTPCLTNVGKRPENFEFSENIFRSHDGRGKILNVMKAQANGIICSGVTDKYL
jgi:hypothetical protein